MVPESASGAADVGGHRTNTTAEPRLPFFEGKRDGGHDGVEGIFLLIEDLVPRRPRMLTG